MVIIQVGIYLMSSDDDLKFDLSDLSDAFFGDIRYFNPAENPVKVMTLLWSFVTVCDQNSAFFSSLLVVFNDSLVP